MPLDLPPVVVIEDVVNDVAAATVGRPPLLDVIDDLAVPCDPQS